MSCGGQVRNFETSTRYSREIPGKSGQALVIPRKFPARSAGKIFLRVFSWENPENPGFLKRYQNLKKF